MKIGLDLDGVVFDSERTFRTYEEVFDIENNLNGLINRSEPKYQERYSWSEKKKKEFEKYWIEISRNSTLMPGFKKIYELLKKENIKLIVITKRGLDSNGMIFQGMEDDAKRILDENGIIFDKYYWKQVDKLDACIKENIDIMIDDDYHIIDRLSKNNISTIYYRDARLKKIQKNKYIKEANNWGDIYRIIYNIIKEKEKTI